MKISPGLLHTLAEQGDVVSVNGRWFLAIDRLDEVYDPKPASKLSEPRDEGVDADRPEIKRGR